MRKKIKLIFFIALINFIPITIYAQTIGIKTNALGWVALQPNLGLDVGIGDMFSFNVEGMFGPFILSNGYRMKVQGAQGEFKYWFKEKFHGPAIGVYGNWAKYDYALAKYRYLGDMYGTGVSFGYTWFLCSNWALELVGGIGWEHFKQENKYLRKDPLVCFGPASRNYVGLNRIGVNFIYYFGVK